jgi:uncharacterized protein
MRPLVAVAAVIAALALPAGPLAAESRPGDAPRGPSTLRVTGEGRASAAPDVAQVLLGAEALAPDLTTATRDANERMRRLLDALLAAGVARKDLQTTRYDVGIERRAAPGGELGPIAGYRVTSEVRATVRDIARVGPILDAALKAGSNAIRSLSFAKDDSTEEQHRALAAAVSAARAKAAVVARAAGRELGEILEIAEGSLARPFQVGARAMALSGAAVEPGELAYAAQVEVVFALR